MNAQANSQPAQPMQLLSPGSRDLTGLLQALASQTAQTQAMLTALMSQSSQPPTPTPAAVDVGNSSAEALIKALMAGIQQSGQQLPAADPRADIKRLKIAKVPSLSSSSPSSSSCTSPTLDAELRSARQLASFTCGDESTSSAGGFIVGGGGGGGGGAVKSAIGTVGASPDQRGQRGDANSNPGVKQSVRNLKRPLEPQFEHPQQQAALRQTQFPATCSLLSGVSAVPGTAATSAATTSKSTVITDADRRRLQQGRPESASCDNCYGPYQLLVAAQPELNHRARYLTEGSRGAVKDRSQTGYPAVQLLGWSQPVELCVFAGSDTGRPRPHGYYQVCRVAGRHGCCEAREVVQDGTRMLLIPLQPRDGAVISLDCIGILKLRNADVDYHHQQQQPLYEQHSTKIPRSGRSSNGKRSSKVRLVFRVVLPLSDGTRVTLQTATQAIECSQPTGQPEIHRLSSHESMARGGGDLFIIGRNFGKGAQVVFREAAPRPGAAIWEASAAIETELSATNHLVCRVPAFGSCVNEDDNDIVSDNSNEEASRDQLAAGSLPVLTEPVRVLLRVVCGDKSSEPACFTYLPEFGAAELSNTPVALPGNQSHALAQQQPHADMIDYLHNPGSAHQQLQHLHHRQLDIDAAFLDCQDADVASSMVGSMAHW